MGERSDISKSRPILLYVLYSTGAGLLFAFLALLSRHPELVNRAIALRLNTVVDWSPRVGNILYKLTSPESEGIFVVASLWWCWFSPQSRPARELLVAGICAAVLAGVLAQVYTAFIVSSPKPLFDPVLQLHAPSAIGDIHDLRAEYSDHCNTFPSPRAALYLGMAFAVFLVSSRIGLVSFIFAAVPEGARIVLGLHYATDITGSFFLASALVLLGRTPMSIAGARLVLLVDRNIPAAFYSAAFVFSYELARAFEDVRRLF